jgi:(2Fe-2S) ferredoxin
MTAVSTNQIAESPASQNPRILVCRGQGAKPACGAEAIFKGLTAEAQRLNISVAIEPAKCGCSGSCRRGPFLSLPHMGLFYEQVKEAHIPYILEETIQKGKILFPLLRLNPLQSTRGDLIWEKDHGCIMVMDPSTCMVQVADYLIKFHYGESCGKCVPCRLGIQRLSDLIEAVSHGRAPEDALQEMEGLMTLMQQAAYCAFAGKTSHIILAILANFREEFEIHIKEKRCPVGACKFF